MYCYLPLRAARVVNVVNLYLCMNLTRSSSLSTEMFALDSIFRYLFFLLSLKQVVQ